MSVPHAVWLSDYNPEWPCQFTAERAVLAQVFGANAVSIEHIGSTAVEGLAAKPCVDIAVAVDTLDVLDDLSAGLERAGYEYLGEYGLPGRHFFRKASSAPECPAFHVHVVQDRDYHLFAWRIFRDLLREDSSLRSIYLGLKRRLAARFANDRPSYTAGKGAFIEHVVHTALHADEHPGHRHDPRCSEPDRPR